MGALRFLSIFSSFCINFMILFNFVMVIGGLIYSVRRRRASRADAPSLSDYPMVSVIVPARNEEFVIRRTVLSLLEQDYPADRYEIIVVNDNSSDGTGDVLKSVQEEFPDRAIRVITTDGTNGGRGKSNVLNMALKEALGSVISVYDADNTPEPCALRLLVCALMKNDKAVAVTGKYRTRNRKDSLLTRLIDQETLVSQAVSQAGFWAYFKISLLPGTNYVIHRSALEEIGGWNETALSEDTEVSLRLLAKGKIIQYIPEAVTWEQEPSRPHAWFRQRIRWARGNSGIIAKSVPDLFRRRAYRFKIFESFMIAIYIMLFFGVVFSDFVFICNVFNVFHISMNTLIGYVYRFSWITQILFYFSIAALAIWQEPDERSISSALLMPVLLFVYAKLWIVIIICAAVKAAVDRIRRKSVVWDKTEHLAEESCTESVLLK